MKLIRLIHDIFEIPIYSNQFQRDIGYWLDEVIKNKNKSVRRLVYPLGIVTKKPD